MRGSKIIAAGHPARRLCPLGHRLPHGRLRLPQAAGHRDRDPSSTKGARKVGNVPVDKETIWQEVRRYPSAGLAEFALRIHNELHRRATADDLRRAEGQHPEQGLQGDQPEAVVLHHSDGSYRGGVAWISNPASKVSYHVLIARDGRRTVFANDTKGAGTPARATGRAAVTSIAGASA
jgi:hypothetical protein